MSPKRGFRPSVTRREINEAYLDLTKQYDQLRRIAVAILRAQGGAVRVSREAFDESDATWVIAAEPIERGAAVEVSATQGKRQSSLGKAALCRS
jgi:hypothetical protein